MTTETAFQPFGKIARLSRGMVVTEKLEGTNAQVWIESRFLVPILEPGMIYVESTDTVVRAGSRNQWLAPNGSIPTPEGQKKQATDNFGFAAWVHENAEELSKLGPGRHFGEWWGQGIQRNYGLKEKRFSLFNVGRWVDPNSGEVADGNRMMLPRCCHLVPVLFRGDFNTTTVAGLLEDLRVYGSQAAPGFMKPEGVVVYHAASGQLFKKTIEKDSEPKGLAA